MSSLRYTSAARLDLATILDYIARDKPTAALKWVQRIEDRCLLISRNPELGELRPEFDNNVRSNVVGRYVIYHRQVDNGTQILRVLPGDMEISNLQD